LCFNSDSVEAGRTVRDAGAKIFFSHGPLNAASLGPEQEVSRQQLSAKEDEKRDQRLSKTPSQYICAIGKSGTIESHRSISTRNYYIYLENLSGAQTRHYKHFSALNSARG
jgi:hypothetical protein